MKQWGDERSQVNWALTTEGGKGFSFVVFPGFGSFGENGIHRARKWPFPTCRADSAATSHFPNSSFRFPMVAGIALDAIGWRIMQILSCKQRQISPITTAIFKSSVSRPHTGLLNRNYLKGNSNLSCCTKKKFAKDWNPGIWLPNQTKSLLNQSLFNNSTSLFLFSFHNFQAGFGEIDLSYMDSYIPWAWATSLRHSKVHVYSILHLYVPNAHTLGWGGGWRRAVHILPSPPHPRWKQHIHN
jgi:hypothetical protein